MVIDNFLKRETNTEEKTYPNIKLEKNDSLETLAEWFGLSTKEIDRDEIRKRIANLLFQSGISKDEECELTLFKRENISYNLHLNKEDINYTLSFCWENELKNTPEWKLKNEHITRRYYVFHNYAEKNDTLFLREEVINNKETKFIRENSKEEVIIKLQDKGKTIEIKIDNNPSTEIIIDRLKEYIAAIDNTNALINKSDLEKIIIRTNNDMNYTLDEINNQDTEIRKKV